MTYSHSGISQRCASMHTQESAYSTLGTYKDSSLADSNTHQHIHQHPAEESACVTMGISITPL